VLTGAAGGIVLTGTFSDAISFVNEYAPEHLELHVEDPEIYFGNLTNYGSLFIGEETTVAYGDKSIGTNHILPTSRAARYTGGVWVGKFDGKAYPVNDTYGPGMLSIKRVNRSTLSSVSKSSDSKHEVNATTSLSDDGKTLTRQIIEKLPSGWVSWTELYEKK